MTVKDDIGQMDAGGVTGIAYVMSPDDVKVELVEMKAQAAPIVSHHIHFFGQQSTEMRDWYINTKVAFVTDPWGTLIELSDGLRAIRNESPQRTQWTPREKLSIPSCLFVVNTLMETDR